MRKYYTLALGLLILTSPMQATGQDAEPWPVRENLSLRIANFKVESPVLEHMRNNDFPNDMTFAPSGDGNGTDDASNIKMMPIYELLACMHITNPESDMSVNAGGGYDITVKNAKFAHGSWDARVMITERAAINLLEADKTLLLSKVVVGDITMGTNDQRRETVKMLVANCAKVYS